jgi:hypothetical protein
VPEQNTDCLNWHAALEKINGEGIPKPVSMTIGDSGNLENSIQRPSHIGPSCQNATVPGPEEVLRTAVLEATQSLNDLRRKRDVNGHPGFLLVKEQPISVQDLRPYSKGITNPQSAVPQQKYKRPDPSCTVAPGFMIWILKLITSREYSAELLLSERQGWQLLFDTSPQPISRILDNPSNVNTKLEETLQPFEILIGAYS